MTGFLERGVKFLERKSFLRFEGEIQDDNLTPILGTLASAAQIDPRLEVTNDPRELSILEVRRPVPQGTFSTVQRDLNSNDQIAGADGTLWTLIRRDDNPATFTVKFWLAKVVTGLDS